MTSKDRVKATFAHEEPDRVPVFELCINQPVAEAIMGREMLVGIGARLLGPIFYEYARKNQLAILAGRIISDHIRLYEDLDLDIIPVPMVPLEILTIEQVSDDVYRWIMPKLLGWRDIKVDLELDTWGEADSDITQGGMEGFRRHVSAMEVSGPPDVPAVTGMLLRNIFQPVSHRFLLGQADIMIPTDKSWFGLFLEAMVTEPELVERYLDLTLEPMLKLIKAQAEAGFDGIVGGTDLAGTKGPFVSPAMFRRFFQPRLKRLAEKCHELGMVYIKHTDGNIMPYEKDFLEGCGFDGYHAIEPQAGMDIRYLKKAYGDKLTLLGNVDCGSLLSLGQPAEVRKVTRELIRDVAPGGGYVLSSSNSIHSGVRTENFLAMLEVAREFGQYPVRA
jgi:hypothetical protein